MKTTKLLLVIPALVGLLLAGCVSSIKPETADTISAVIRPVAKNVVNAVLAKNPKHADALQAVAIAADAATGADLAPEAIKSFVDGLAARYALDHETKLVIASAIDDVLHAYTDVYGKPPAATDPNVRKYLAAFAKGIREGIAFRSAINAP